MIEEELDDSVGSMVVVTISNQEKTVVASYFSILLLSNLMSDRYFVGHFPNNCVTFTKEMVSRIDYDEDGFPIIQIVI